MRRDFSSMGDPLLTGKIALAHLRELPDYYTRPARMEAEGEVTSR